MKKTSCILLGIFIGIGLTAATTAFSADISLTGKKVAAEYDIIVDGRLLDKKAINVEGYSYTPNRVLAEAVGYDIEFTEDKKVVMSKKKGDQMNVETQTNNVNNPNPNPNTDDELNLIEKRIEEIIRVSNSYNANYLSLKDEWNTADTARQEEIMAELNKIGEILKPLNIEMDELIKRKEEIKSLK